MNRLLLAVLLAFGVLVSGGASGQAFPAKPIRIMVPFPPGGATDIFARQIAQKMTESWGQQVVVENKAGASGTIGSDQVAKSAPDGYSLLLTATHHSINPALLAKLPYDTLRDFSNVALIATSPNVLLLHPSVPANTVQELVAFVKAKPGGLHYASSSAGGATHLTAELFKTAAGINLIHVPYKGAAPAMTDLLGGQVTMMFDVLSTSMPHVRAGKLKALGVSSSKRSAIAPDVPTIAESGLPGFEAMSWFGLYAPAGVPKDIVNKVNAEVVRILHLADVKEKLAQQGAEPGAMNAVEFDAFLRAEMVKWAKAVKDSGARAD